MAESAGSDRRRDDLAALRIDRSAGSVRERPAWLGRAWIAGASALFLLLSVLAWRATLGRVAEVSVDYAQLTGSGAASAAVVLTGSGYVVTGDRYIALGVRVPGRIEAYLVEEGQRIEAGQPLVKLDARPFEADLAEARAALAEARAQTELASKELVRQEELRSREVGSQAAFDVKQTQLAVAHATAARLAARVAQLELDLEDTVLRAPTGGIVLEKLKEVSEIAVPGGFAGSGELIRIANTDELRAELDINESDLAKVKLDQPAEITPDAYPDRRYAARVVKLYPQINRQKGTLKVEVRILEPDEWLRPDMSVRVTFFADEPARGEGEAPRVLAPRDALRRDDQGEFAWVVTDGRLRRQPLTSTGDAADGRAVVSQGLTGGEALVIGAVEGLREGQRVDVSAPRAVSAVFDTVVVGAGVVGLAIARAEAMRGREVVILESEARFGTATSSRNSEVIHAGIYNPTDTLKTRLCVSGRRALYRYCAERGIDHRCTGKLLVATDEEEEAALERLVALAAANGLEGKEGLVRLTAAEAHRLEPELRCRSAALSPSTGVIDPEQLMHALLGDAEQRGAHVAYHAPVEGADAHADGFTVRVGGVRGEEVRCRRLINSAGLGANELARKIGGYDPARVPPLYLVKGSYFVFAGASPFRRPIYPTRHGGLSVHSTIDLGGQLKFGPDVQYIPALDYSVDETRVDSFYRAARRFFPALSDGALRPGYAGIRPKLIAPGEPWRDFSIDGPAQHGVAGLVQLYGIESPGLTACLALGELVAEL